MKRRFLLIVNKIKSQLETVNKIGKFFSNKLIERKIDNMLDLLEKAKEQIKQGKTEQAKNTYKKAYQIYYKLPIEEQTHIITELQNIQQRIHEYKPQIKTKKTLIDQIKDFFQQKLTVQTTSKAKNLVKEAQKQVNQGKTEQAKNTYKKAYQIYYKLPIEEQILVLYQLKKIKDGINEKEKEKERQESEELSKELNKLKSDEEVYVIMEKGDIPKKLSHLTSYAQKVGEQEIHGLKAGKDHLKEKLKDLVKTAEKIERKEEKKLTSKEKSILTKIKELGSFFTKKEEDIEKAFKQTQKHVFGHTLTKQAKEKPTPQPAKPVPELKPQKPPAPPHLKEKRMAHLDEQKLQKERLTKPLEIPKAKMNIERLKRLQEEKKVMEETKKAPRIQPLPIRRVRERQQLKKYPWEITAEEVRRKKTKSTGDLLKEERDIQSKLRELEEI